MSSYATIAQQLASVGQNLPSPDNFGEDAAMAKMFGSGKASSSSTGTPASQAVNPLTPMQVNAPGAATVPTGTANPITSLDNGLKPLPTATSDPGTQAPSATMNGQPIAGEPNWVANSPASAGQSANLGGGVGSITAQGGTTASGTQSSSTVTSGAPGATPTTAVQQVTWPTSAAPGTGHGAPPAGGYIESGGVQGTGAAGPTYVDPSGNQWMYNGGVWTNVGGIEQAGNFAGQHGGISNVGAGGAPGAPDPTKAPTKSPLGINLGPNAFVNFLPGVGSGSASIGAGIYSVNDKKADTSSPQELARSLLAQGQQTQAKSVQMGVMPKSVQQYVAMRQAASQHTVGSLVSDYVKQKLAESQS